METVTLDPYALVDLDTARDYLKRKTTDDDERVKWLVNAVSAAIEMHTRRRLLERVYDGEEGNPAALTLNGSGCSEIVIPEWPVTEVTEATEVYDDGTTRVIDLSNYRIRGARILKLFNDSFPRGTQNIVVKCTAGYNASTHAREVRTLELATCRWLQVAWQDREQSAGRGVGFSVSGESISLFNDPIPKDVERMLMPFERLL